MRRAGLVVLLALLALAPAVPAAHAEVKTETADAGTVHAEFSYDRSGDRFTSLELKISDNGTPTVDEKVPDDDFLQPGGFEDRPSLHAEDFDGDGVPEVVLDLYTGGAHCCLESWVYHGTSPKVVHKWGDVGYRFTDVDGDGRNEFLSADDRFAGAFTSYASSRFPLQVWAWSGGRFLDITRQDVLRPRLRHEAATLRKAYRKAHDRIAHGHSSLLQRERVRSSLAAYAADRCSLGTCAYGFAVIDRARRRHEVPKGFKRDVRKLLRAGGYLKP
jgi:hypothetical protein